MAWIMWMVVNKLNVNRDKAVMIEFNALPHNVSCDVHHIRMKHHNIGLTGTV